MVTSIADFDNRATSTLQADGDTGLLDFKGKTVGQIEQMRDEGVIDALFDLVVKKNLETGSLHGEVHLDEAAMAPILIYPNAIIGLSDGGAHVQFQSGFGFSTPLLAEFDPDTVRPLPLEVVHDFPTGAKHIKEPAEGIIATVVNGEVVMEGDKHTGTLPPPRVKQHLLPREPRLIAEA